MILPHIIARYASIQTLRQDAWHSLKLCLQCLRPKHGKIANEIKIERRSRHLIKSKNPMAPAVKREAEQDWGRPGRPFLWAAYFSPQRLFPDYRGRQHGR
jgi:hypothetical protein